MGVGGCSSGNFSKYNAYQTAIQIEEYAKEDFPVGLPQEEAEQRARWNGMTVANNYASGYDADLLFTFDAPWYALQFIYPAGRGSLQLKLDDQHRIAHRRAACWSFKYDSSATEWIPACTDGDKK